jgi:hypothetical protein
MLLSYYLKPSLYFENLPIFILHLEITINFYIYLKISDNILYSSCSLKQRPSKKEGTRTKDIAIDDIRKAHFQNK